MYLQPFIHVPNANPVALLGYDRLRGRKGFAVDGNSDPSVVENQNVITVDPGFRGFVGWVDDECTHQTARYLLCCVVVGMVHMCAAIFGNELVGKRSSRSVGRLFDKWN